MQKFKSFAKFIMLQYTDLVCALVGAENANNMFSLVWNIYPLRRVVSWMD